MMTIINVLNYKNSKIKLIQLFGLIGCIASFISFEFYVLTSKNSKYFQDILDKSEQDVFEVLKQDFSKLIYLSNGSKIQLKFLRNVTLEERGNENISVIKNESFIKISYPKNTVIISINEIKANVANLLFKEINFNFDTKKITQPRKFERSYQILDGLVINYYISKQYVNQIKTNLLIEALQRYSVLLSLFILFHRALFKAYQQKIFSFFRDKILKLEITNKKLKEKCDNLERESELISIIHTHHIDGSKYKVRLAKICKLLKKHFNKENSCISISNLVGSEIYLEIPESEVTKIVTSIIFYRQSLVEHFKLKLVIKSDNLCISIFFKDNAFSLTKDQLVSYTANTQEPHYIMKCPEIFDSMKRHSILYKIFTNKHSMIKVQIPINRKFYNVWHLKDYSTLVL